MASKTEIANLALFHLGNGKEISNLDTDRGENALVCRRFYDIALKATLRDFPWPFATKIADLVLVEEDPNDDWSYSYRYPSDCVLLRRILSGTYPDTQATRISYKLAQDDADGLIIFTDQDDAQAEYTLLAENPLIYTQDFVIAFSYRLATFIAPRVSGADFQKIAATCFNNYLYEISKAEVNAVNEESPGQAPDAEYIRARE